MTFNHRIGLSMAGTVLMLTACGGDEASNSPFASASLAEQEALLVAESTGEGFRASPSNAARAGAGSARVAIQPSAGPVIPSTATVVTGQATSAILNPIAGKLIQWSLTAVTLRDLFGHQLAYVDEETDKVYRGQFDRDGLLVTEYLGPKGFVALPSADAFLLESQVGHHPFQMWDEDGQMLIEMADCEISVEDGEFLCEVTGDAPARIYESQPVSDLTSAPEFLACLNGCPTYGGDFFASVDHTQPVETQLVEYRLDVEDGLLYLGAWSVLPKRGGSYRSGPLFEASPDNLQAMACDFDEDGEPQETCVWSALEKFYTYGVNNENPLPFRAPAISVEGVEP